MKISKANFKGQKTRGEEGRLKHTNWRKAGGLVITTAIDLRKLNPKPIMLKQKEKRIRCFPKRLRS